VTITGANFGATQGTSTVKFNGTDSDTDELECDEHSCAGTGRSDDGECSGDGGRSGEQWCELYGDGTWAEYYELESDFGVGGRVGDDHGSELWATQGTSTVKFNGTTATPTSWSATSIVCASTGGSDDGERSRNGRRSGQQRV